MGFLQHPEALDPNNELRAVGLARVQSIVARRKAGERQLGKFVDLGTQAQGTGQHNQNSYLLESTLNFLARNYAYTRLELLDKDELFPEDPAHPAYRIGAYTFGAVRDLVHSEYWQVGLGGDVTFYSKPAVLDPIYGNNPVSLHVFVRIRAG